MRRPFVVVLCALALVMPACATNERPRAASIPRRTTTTTVPATTTTTAPPLRTFANTTSDDPHAAAVEIIAAEGATLDPATNPEELSNAAIALQLGYRKLAGVDVAAENAVQAQIPDYGTRKALAENVAAARHLIALTGTSTARDAPPAAWLIVAPAPADELLGYYKEGQAKTGVPWQVLASIHLVETRYGRIRGVSSAGAQGPMQFLPSTWAAYGQGDINSNRDAILSAANYLKANGAPERLDDAIFRYNHSRNYVAAIRAYANRMTDAEAAFRGYHQWQVLYRTVGGTLMLPTGWPSVPAVPVVG